MSTPSLNRFFKIDKLQITVKTEIISGLTTFLAMAYITFAYPAISIPLACL